MSARWRMALVVASAAALGAFALLIRGGGRVEEAPTQSSSPEVRGEQLRSELDERVERESERAVWRSARREDSSGEPGPTPRTLRRYVQLKRRAAPVARRFFGAFARYEVGAAGAEVAASLRATATTALARQLLRSPPRVRPTAGKPEPGTLGRLELVPGEVQGGRLASAELVGWLRREGERAPLAIELALERGHWRVNGLGQ